MTQTRTSGCCGSAAATSTSSAKKTRTFRKSKPRTTAQPVKRDCGCGCGGGGGCGGSCGCETCGVTTIVRPRFFSGQLLTEGDLQLLTDYVGTKDRLHNRYLHGDGVVCGLDLRCHPCDPGKVIVLPGAALDCCGNDIFVPCPEELDVNAMIRDLRLEQLAGYDCGDPCEDNGNDDPDQPNRELRRYCLYLHYCEDLTEPVAPYSTDDGCASVTCEASRVEEGYRFELRCRKEDDDPPDILDRIRCCIEDLESASRSAENVRVAAAYSRRASEAFYRVGQEEVPEFVASDREVVIEGGERLAELVSALEKEAKDENGGLEAPDEATLRQSLDVFQNTASAIVRYDLVEKAERRMDDSEKELAEAVESARTAVLSAAPILERQAASGLTSSLDRSFALTATQQAMKYTDPQISPELRRSPEALRFAYNAPYSVAVQNDLQNRLEVVRDWLLRKIDERGLFADCKLRELILGLRFDRTNEVNVRTPEAALELARAFLRYLIDCICAALNPPCAPCEDPGVKLACLEVADCEVIRICNLERKFVLSWPAIRYWVPLLKNIGDAFERLCCELGRKFDYAPSKPRREPNAPVGAPVEYRFDYYQESAATRSHAAFVEEEPLSGLLRLANVTPASAAAGVSLGIDVGKLVAAEPVTGVRDFSRGVSATGLPDSLATAFRGATESAELFEHIRAIDDELKERPTSRGLSSTSAFRNLKKSLDEQVELNKKLEQRIAKLEKKK